MIACNTEVTDGMVVSNQSEKVKEAVKWGLDFHLINHPLDCPICDQAGECGLQDQYMKFGQYDPEMGEAKVKKRKVVDLGPRVVLDSERCILCSRCVRFTDEVTGTSELGIFNRGDRAEIGTHEDKALNNDYSVNVVDICPVGALTSKGFRFKQRVWYLDHKKSVCPGCSTGCNVNVYYNEKGHFRVKPEYNAEINQYWMCDNGRDTLEHVNRDKRLLKGSVKDSMGQKWMPAGSVAKAASERLKQYDANEIAVVMTGQYTLEEYQASFTSFIKDLGLKNVFHWVNNEDQFEDFDGFLIRGDKNPNTSGLLRLMEENQYSGTWADFQSGLEAGKFKAIIVAGPEIQKDYPGMKDELQKMSKVDTLIWMASNSNPLFESVDYLIPMKTWVEKNGTFINHAGLEQKIKATRNIVSDALSLSQVSYLLAGKELGMES